MKPAALALLLAAGGSACAQDVTGPVGRVGIATEHFRLDRGHASWDEVALHVSRQWSTREAADLGLARTRRFGLDDTEVRAAGSRALSPTLTASVQASASPSHRVLARGSLGAAVQYEIAPAWLLHGGLRHTAYDVTSVEQARLGVERYVGAFSLLGAWSPARGLGRRTDAYQVRGGWSGAGGGSAGLLLAWGTEAAQVGDGQVALADVRAVAVLGRLPVVRGLWLTWAASRTRQGTYYTRTGGTLGLQADF